MNILSNIRKQLLDARESLDQFISNDLEVSSLVEATLGLGECLQKGGKAISCGNGGSMSDAMHFAEELTGRFRDDRRALPAIAVSDPGHLSCVANDYGYRYVFSRYVEAHGKLGDFLLAISTSGKSENVLEAVKQARNLNMKVCLLTGSRDTEMAKLADWVVCTPGPDGGYADRVQELHIKCIHMMISGCEQILFAEK